MAAHVSNLGNSSAQISSIDPAVRAQKDDKLQDQRCEIVALAVIELLSMVMRTLKTGVSLRIDLEDILDKRFGKGFNSNSINLREMIKALGEGFGFKISKQEAKKLNTFDDVREYFYRNVSLQVPSNFWK